jgi:hypothetical protein
VQPRPLDLGFDLGFGLGDGGIGHYGHPLSESSRMIRNGGHRFSEKIMRKQNLERDGDPNRIALQQNTISGSLGKPACFR